MNILSTPTEGVQKIKTKKTSIAIWNVRTRHQEGQRDVLLDELRVYQKHADVVMWMQNGYTIIRSGREDDIYRQGVPLFLSSEYANGLLSYEDAWLVAGSKPELLCESSPRNMHQTYVILMNNANASRTRCS